MSEESIESEKKAEGLTQPEQSITDVSEENHHHHHHHLHIPGEKATALTLEILAKGANFHDPYHPIHWKNFKKWSIVVVYTLLQVFVQLTSTTYVSAKFTYMDMWGTNEQVATLGQSMFIVGQAIGPLFLSPLSDVGGRKWVYVGGTFCYALLNIGTALSVNIGMLIAFQFLSGIAGSVAVVNVAGTIADLFGDLPIQMQAMCLFVASANIGPSIGSPVGQLIVDNTSMSIRWTFWINVIIGGVFAAFLCLMPETLPRIVISRAAAKGVDPEGQIVLESKISLKKEILFVSTMALRLMCTEPIIIFLAIFNGFAYGMLFLWLDGIFDVFVVNNGMSEIMANVTYLNFVVGVVLLFLFMPIQTWFYNRDKAKTGGRPEARFITSLVGAWGFPAGLLWGAFTSNGSYWSPILAGTLFGFSDPLLWLAMLSYLTDTYVSVPASACAALLIPSFIIAAAFAHIGIVMFNNLSTTWALAILGFASFGVVILVYVLYFFGPAIRRRSKYALH